MINKNPITNKFSYWCIKRFLDITFSIILIIILFPLLLLISLLIATLNGLPVYYSWRVYGFQGKEFVGYKFRTMYRYADSQKKDLQELNEMSGPVFKVSNDPRITKFGKFLRKYSLDELPQLYSVLKGEMSFIGPRPAGFNEYPEYQDWQRRKLSVVPGMSCLWQVEGRNKIDSFDEWVKLDLKYIDNWSLVLDTKIFFRTILVVLRGTGK